MENFLLHEFGHPEAQQCSKEILFLQALGKNCPDKVTAIDDKEAGQWGSLNMMMREHLQGKYTYRMVF